MDCPRETQGAAASKPGAAFLGVGAIVTAPILVCLLAAAFVSLTTVERAEFSPRE